MGQRPRNPNRFADAIGAGDALLASAQRFPWSVADGKWNRSDLPACQLAQERSILRMDASEPNNGGIVRIVPLKGKCFDEQDEGTAQEPPERHDASRVDHRLIHFAGAGDGGAPGSSLYDCEVEGGRIAPGS